MNATYTIFQLKPTDAGKDLLHQTFKAINGKVNPDNYDKIWTDEVEWDEVETPFANRPFMPAIQLIEKALGNDLPSGFYGHMLTVSDIIILQFDNADPEGYYVDAIGYKHLDDEVINKLMQK